MEKNMGFVFTGIIIDKQAQPDPKNGGQKFYLHMSARGCPDVLKIKVNEATFSATKENTVKQLPIQYSKFNNNTYWSQAEA